MARRRRGAPHVIAYWWKSPSRARWAAATSSAGGGKSGIPCARLIPPCSSLTRVISRMTDSVNAWTRLEITRDVPTGEPTGRRSPAAGDGGHDGHVVAGLEGGLAAVQEADVLLVDVHVDEPPQLARLVDQALAHAGELAL